MSQQQRVMLVGAGVVLLAAVGLIAKSLIGGGATGSTEAPPAVIEAINESAASQAIKPPPELTDHDKKIDEVPEGSKKGVQPADG